ncbi:MAG: putative glycoside hydrolase [Lacunisphaera sp.]
MKKTYLAVILAAVLVAVLPLAAKEPGDFPRLLGMNIGKKIYDNPQYQAQLARLDIAILGFNPGWNPQHVDDPIGSVLRNLRRMNPAIKLGQYTIINETYDDPAMKANADVLAAVEHNNWWLHNATGQKVQWTPRYHTWEINCTAWAPTDAQGRRYPQWRAEWDNAWAFQPHPEFDVWYCDNVMYRPRVTGDWDGDGRTTTATTPRILAAYRTGMASFWAAIRQLQPKLLLMGNTDGDLSQPEFQHKLDGAFLEGWMGASYAIERRQGWTAAMALYRTAKANVTPNGIVSVNIHGALNDYRLLRYALASCLLDDGYFSYSDSAGGGYSTVPWFDEFEAPLGRAISEPAHEAWQNGVWRRDYAGGVALVNPAETPVTVTVEAGFHKLRGAQAPDVNDGQAASRVTLAGKDGIILLRDR